jgi:hypothetical protein
MEIDRKEIPEASVSFGPITISGINKIYSLNFKKALLA